MREVAVACVREGLLCEGDPAGLERGVLVGDGAR